MQTTIGIRALAAALFVLGAAIVPCGPAHATGTAIISRPDGSHRTYTGVRIVIWNESMALTSSDGAGTVVIGKASCTMVGELLRCLPWDATLFQDGNKLHIPLKSGTVWLNPSRTTQPVSHSSTQLPPRGVLLAMETKRGTYVTLTGTVDEVHR